jgi:hypothetical protein
MSEATQFTSGEVLIVATDLVVEVFHRAYEKPSRLPTAWVGIRIKANRHDEYEVTFGQADPPDQPIYGENVNVSNYGIVFDVPSEDEPRLRAFFADVAARAGRRAT